MRGLSKSLAGALTITLVSLLPCAVWAAAKTGEKAASADLTNVRKLIAEGHYDAASAVVRMRLALEKELSEPDHLRLSLLKALLEARSGEREMARTSLVTARKIWMYSPDPGVRGNPQYLTEVEMTEFDVRTLEEQ